MRLYDLLSTIICIIIVILFLLFQRLKPTDFEQVKAGVTYVASPPITSDGRADRLPFFRAFLRWVAKGSSHFKQW